MVNQSLYLFISACVTGGVLTQSITHVILIQARLCTELLTGVGDLSLWQRCISGWVMAWFLSRFAFIVCQSSSFCTPGQPCSWPYCFDCSCFQPHSKSSCFVDTWVSGLGHDTERMIFLPFPRILPWVWVKLSLE